MSDEIVNQGDDDDDDDDDDDEPRLSSSTLAALQEFYEEKDMRERLEKSALDSEVLFDENWQLSQFWYDEDTINKLTKAIVNSTGSNEKVALISCPSLYKNLKKLSGNREIKLLEYDKRFSAFGFDYVFYDYKDPLNLPRDWELKYDLVMADPPFLSEECLRKTASTIKFLTRGKIIICTGAVMRELVEELLNVTKCSFKPQHRNNLANEFFSYSNFQFDEYLQ